MNVALISIGNCPSLALRNIKRYCLGDDTLREALHFEIYDYDIREFRNARPQSSLRWSFVTQFDETLRAMLRTRPRVIGFSCYLWSIETSLHVAHMVKQVLPHTITVFGGPDAGPRSRELLAAYPQVDLVVEGDGELPMLGLLQAVLRAEPDAPLSAIDLSAVPQLRHRDPADPAGVVENPSAPELIDMARLAGVYTEGGETIPDQEAMNKWTWPYVLFETLRGCPYSCSYCMYGKTPMNARDTEPVVEELVELLSTGLAVEIIDPTFTTYKKRAKDILRRLGEHDYTGTLTFEAYPDSLDEEMVELIAGARVSCIGIGFQTLSSEGLKAVKRPKNLPRFERAIRLLREHGINFYVDLIYGLPDTTQDDFYATVDYLHDLDIRELMVYRLLGLPGSPMMDDAEKYELVFSQIPPYELLSSHSYTLEDLLECENFQFARDELLGRLPTAAMDRLVAEAGSLSALVRRYMEGGHGSPDAFRRALERQGQWPLDASNLGPLPVGTVHDPVNSADSVPSSL